MTSIPQAGETDDTGERVARGGIDPIRFEVIRNALTEIAEEMAASLRRSCLLDQHQDARRLLLRLLRRARCGPSPSRSHSRATSVRWSGSSRPRSPTTVPNGWDRATRSWSITRTSVAGISTT